jgi:hypothetical protein
MAYTTPDLVRQTLTGEDDEEGGTAATLSDDQINYEINGARADVDAALRETYLLPFDSPDDSAVPLLIKQITTDIACYGADLNYRKGREYDNQNMPVPLRYQRATQLLENLRTGTITLDWPRSNVDSSGAGVVHMYSPQLMWFEDIFATRREW